LHGPAKSLPIAVRPEPGAHPRQTVDVRLGDSARYRLPGGENDPLSPSTNNFMSETVALTRHYAAMREVACCHANKCMDSGIWYT